MTEQFGVFVTEKGRDDAAGTRDAPFATVTKAIAAGKAAGKRVYICVGTYREGLVLEDAIPVVGGLDCSQPREWKPGNGYSRLEAPTSPALRADKITSTTRVEGLEVVAPDAVESSGSSIAFVASEAGKLTLARSRVLAGAATAGADGVEGPQQGDSGTPAQHGRAQEPYVSMVSGGIGVGVKRCSDNVVARAGGTSVCVATPGVNGASGGSGGYPGRYKFVEARGWEPVDLEIMLAGCHDGAARPGEERTYVANPDGANGSSALSWGTLSTNGFTPRNGSAGTNGQPGGGGSGAIATRPTVAPTPQEFVGNAGPGGGAGGCPGVAGTAGQGGGASIAALLVASPMTFDHVELVAKDGGDGGKGTFGSQPTPGGAPGAALGALFAKPGQDGGKSGWSGSGAGGPSIAIAYMLGAATLRESTTTVGRPGAGVPLRSQGAKTIAASVGGIAQESFEFGN